MSRRALRASPANRPKAGKATIPAPVGGLNTRDPQESLPITDATIMQNWMPNTGYVSPRPGSDTHIGGYPSQVESILTWTGASACKILVAVSTMIMDATSATATYSASSTVGSGYSNARWQSTMFGTPGGQFLIACNGADTPQRYDGTTLTNASIICSGVTATASSFIGVNEYKQRLFFIEKNSTRFWYMEAVNAIGGTAKSFDLGSLFSLGGALVAMGTWTRDGGSGMDDVAVFLSDKGEAAVYTGADPGTADSWSLEGIYTIPSPLGRRCLQKFGGDLLVLTETGVLPFSSVLSGLEPQSFVTDKIRPTIKEYVDLSRSRFGWQIKYYPPSNWLIVNVPVSEGANQRQYVMNTLTGAWGEWTGIQANVFEVANNKLYYGGNAKIVEMGVGTNDDGTNINVDIQQAQITFGTPAYKHFKLYRPQIATDGDLPLAFGFNTDFAAKAPISIPTPVAVVAPVWDEADWDVYDWAGGASPVGRWQSPAAGGVWGGVRIKGAVNTETIRWYATEVIFEQGSPLG